MAILDGRSGDTVLERHAPGELHEGRSALPHINACGSHELVGGERAPRSRSRNVVAMGPTDEATFVAGPSPKSSSTSSAHVTGIALKKQSLASRTGHAPAQERPHPLTRLRSAALFDRYTSNSEARLVSKALR